MLVLLPPSETKSDGGAGAPLDLAELAMPQLTETREVLVQALVALAADAGGVAARARPRPGQADEIERNATLWISPTRPALERYTGVLFDALDAKSFTRRAEGQGAVAGSRSGSALFGAVRAGDPIPAYRLSGGIEAARVAALSRSLWKPELRRGARRGGRTASSSTCGRGRTSNSDRSPGPSIATVLTEKPDGTRTVVSHFNKHHKGLLARALTVSRAEPQDSRGRTGGGEGRPARRDRLGPRADHPHRLTCEYL